MSKEAPLFSHPHRIQKGDRVKLLGQKPLVIWFTGLSGSGKSTLADLLETNLHQRGLKTILLDGDKMRQGLNKDLGFDDAGREENIRRIGELCKLFNEAGLITITSFISPFRKERDWVRSLFEPTEFIEIFINTPLELCESRDPKGLYKLARAGKIQNFTGIDSAYEVPEKAELVIETEGKTTTQSSKEIVEYIDSVFR